MPSCSTRTRRARASDRSASPWRAQRYWASARIAQRRSRNGSALTSASASARHLAMLAGVQAGVEPAPPRRRDAAPRAGPPRCCAGGHPSKCVERRPAPQRQGLAEVSPPPDPVRRTRSAPGPAGRALEAAGVDLVVVEGEPVAAGGGLDRRRGPAPCGSGRCRSAPVWTTNRAVSRHTWRRPAGPVTQRFHAVWRARPTRSAHAALATPLRRPRSGPAHQRPRP